MKTRRRAGLAKAVRDHLAELGRKGGEAVGESKKRGGKAYYQKMSRKRWETAKHK
jgi:general stress protein YciG